MKLEYLCRRFRIMVLVGRLKTYHNMVVANIDDECILGTEFLTPHKCEWA